MQYFNKLCYYFTYTTLHCKMRTFLYFIFLYDTRLLSLPDSDSHVCYLAERYSTVICYAMRCYTVLRLYVINWSNKVSNNNHQHTHGIHHNISQTSKDKKQLQ